MENIWRQSLWSGFGAALDMCEDALRACPEDLWNTPPQQPGPWSFWYTAFHALFWADVYLSGSPDGFTPPSPFTLDEFDPAGRLPPRAYTKEELLGYARYCRTKARSTIEALTEETASRPCRFPWGQMSYGELLLDNIRHLQGHVAELGIMLGQRLGSGPGWVGRVRGG